MFNVSASQANVRRYKDYCSRIMDLDIKFWNSDVVPYLKKIEYFLRKYEANPKTAWQTMEKAALRMLNKLKIKLHNV